MDKPVLHRCPDCDEESETPGRCESCNDCYSICDRCDNEYHIDYGGSVRGGWVCERCLDDASYCDDCEEAYFGDGCPNCPGGFDADYPDDFIKFGDIEKSKFPFCLGFEYEIDTRFPIKVIEGFRKIAPGLFFAQHDASVKGVEITSMPATLEFWNGLTPKLPIEHYGELRNGIHVHICREGFSPEVISRVIEFFYDNKKRIHAIGQRETHYATVAPLSMYSRDDIAIYGDKCFAVNTSHDKTIEIRIFRSVTQWPVILAYIQFVAAIFTFIQAKGGEPTFAQFVEYTKDKPEFSALESYLVAKGF